MFTLLLADADLERVPEKIGGFPHGSFRPLVRDLCPRLVSLHPEPRMAWTAAAELLIGLPPRGRSPLA